jgi:hypothetical protein
VHRLGGATLAYLFADLECGKPVRATIEAYAELAPLAPFIEALGGGRPAPLRAIKGGKS